MCLGHRCSNRGVNVKLIEDAVFDELSKHQAELESCNFDVNKNELTVLKAGIQEKYRQIEVEKRAIVVIQKQREEEEITKEYAMERKNFREKNIEVLLSEIEKLEERCAKRECATDENRLNNIKEFYRLWKTTDSVQEKNMFLRSIIDKTSYVREQCEEGSEHVLIKINFLSACSVSKVA